MSGGRAGHGRRLWLAALGLLAVVGLAVCLLGAGGPGAGVAVAATASACPGTAASDTTLTLTSGGASRSAVLHIPPSAPGTALPLIVAFHGYGGNGAEFEKDTGLSVLADKDGFAIVYPSSYGNQWSISGSERDVQFTATVLDQVESVACIDPSRVYATGVSIGAGMAARDGCELSARIAGLVLVSGGYRSLPACNPDRPLSVLEIHGTEDTTVPYEGREGTHAGAVLPYVVAWAARDRCAVSPSHKSVARHTLLYTWGGCASATVVEHMRIIGGRHGLPNAVGEEISGGDASPIDGAREIWHFLASRRLAAPFPPPSPATPPPG